MAVRAITNDAGIWAGFLFCFVAQYAFRHIPLPNPSPSTTPPHPTVRHCIITRTFIQQITSFPRFISFCCEPKNSFLLIKFVHEAAGYVCDYFLVNRRTSFKAGQIDAFCFTKQWRLKMFFCC